MTASLPNILMLTVAAAFASSSMAQENMTLESIVVTGAYSPKTALTSSFSVLHAQDIAALNKRTVAGLLKTLPGVLVEEQGGPGGLTAVSIRGAEANFTLVLLDGVAVNDPTNVRGGGFDFANLNSALIERIELVRGAQSAIYGSDALAGVINIITRRPGEGHQQQVYAEWGEDDFARLGAGFLGRVEALEYTLELSHRDDGEPVKGSTRETDNANLRLAWQVSDAHRLNAGYRYLDGERSTYPEQGGGPRYAVFDDLDKSDYRDQVATLGWEADVTGAWRSTLTADRFDHEDDYTSPGIFPYLDVPPNAAQTEFQRDQLQWVNTLKLSPGHSINVGGFYRTEEGESEGYLEYFGIRLPTDFELDRNTRGLFADISARVNKPLLLQASARYDDPDDFDSETSLQLGASYAFSTGITLATNWGEAFKLPSFSALGHPLVGNPDLNPEKARSWDIGLRWDAADTLFLGATYFFNDYEDLVDFDSEEFRNVNRKTVEISGMELELSWQPLSSLSLNGQATYNDINVKGEDTTLLGRPEWTAGVAGEWQIRERWSTTLDYRWTGNQYAASRHTGEEVTEKLDDFHRLDWVLHWQPDRPWDLRLSVDNLLDEDYETAVGFPAPGRSVRLGVSFSH